MIIAATLATASRSYFVARPCAEIAFAFSPSSPNATDILQSYPACAPHSDGTNPQQQALVRVDMNGQPPNVGAALGSSFGMAIWLALAMHAIGVEAYLQLTPREHERLRNVSYQRQLEAGMKNPGRAGLTVDRVGDAEEWVPAVKDESG